MNVGMVGLGKLGLPVAVSFGQVHKVFGYDLNPALMRKRPYEHKELGPSGNDDFQAYFDKADIVFSSLKEMADSCRVIFVAVQTPHEPKYEGITRIPKTTKDFDYRHLKKAVQDLAVHLGPGHVVAVISTCLPGTMRLEIDPLLKKWGTALVYNPSFIAMGTVMKDFVNPEFVLLGSRSEAARTTVKTVYSALYDAKFMEMSIESAELAKVAYNTFIGMKIVFANTVMEICQNVDGCDADEVMGAIKAAKNRLISTKYLDPGMGDGGGCHPRDGIAMSHLARKLVLSHNLFNDLMVAREEQTEFLVDAIEHARNLTGLKVVILGRAFKPETRITTGSPALLLEHLLSERDIAFTSSDDVPEELVKSVFFVATKHDIFRHVKFPEGSTVIDPHRYIEDQAGVNVFRVGEA
jgi:UDPglucose 6-dehydrogenase